jgi:transcriptional regulator with XRE-family HTH domain
MHKHARADEAIREALRLVVREQRDRSGMSLRELADASGVDRNVINRIEQGGRRTYMDVIPGLASAFHMGPVELFAIVYDRARTILESLPEDDL